MLTLAVAIGTFGVDLAQGATVAAVAPSEVQTEPAAATPNGVQLKGKLNPGNAPTTYWFVYKDTATECEEELGCGPTTAVGGPLEGGTQQEVPPLEVTGLTPGATYRYWLVAVNAKGAARGGELTFVAAPSSPASASGPSSNGPALNAPLGSQSVSAPSAASSPWGGAAASALSGAAPKSTPRKKLSAALRVCEKKPKVRRAACARQARKRYAAVAKKSGYR